MARGEKKKPKQNKPKKQDRVWPPFLLELMQYAIEDPARARALVKSRPDVLDLRTGLGETALHYLAVEGYVEAVELLIKLGAKVNVTNKFGASPLEEALIVKNTGVIEALRRAGATEPTVPEPLDYPDEPE